MIAISIACFGAAVGLAVFAVPEDQEAMRGIAGALATIGLALVIIRFVTRYAAPSKSRVNAARAAGRSANAVVTDLRATNTEINEFRVYQIDLVVDSRDRAPYRTSMQRALDPIAGPNMSPGNVISVVRLREDKPEVAWDPETTPGHVSPTLVDRAGEWSPERTAGTGTGQIQKKPIRWGMLLLPLLFLGTGGCRILRWPVLRGEPGPSRAGRRTEVCGVELLH